MMQHTWFKGKFYLRRIPVNSSGYDSMGQYWGRDKPLFYVSADCEDLAYHIRASNREAAKKIILDVYPHASFHR